MTDAEDDFVPPTATGHRLLADNRLLAEGQRAATAMPDNRRGAPTANLLGTFVDETERRIWVFLDIS